jgi:DNA-binding MarR family transcriptional regulator
MEISIYAARAAAQLGRTVNLALDDVALTPAGYRMLAYLATGETAAKVLAVKLAISRPTVTATLDWLEPQGYVTRSPSLADRRRVDITITPAGHAVLADADRRIIDRLREVLGDVDVDEVASIVRGLEVLGDALNEYRVRNLPPGSRPVGSADG